MSRASLLRRAPGHARLLLFVLLALAAPALASCGSGSGPPTRVGGVAVDVVFGEPPDAVVADVDIAAAMGAEALRVSVQWSTFEIAKGRYAGYYLDGLDTLFRRARESGLRVLLTPVTTPCWAVATPGPDGTTGCGTPERSAQTARLPPTRSGDYADFLAFLARRYRDTLMGIEVWNEPNLRGTWDTPDPAAAYARLLKAVYPAVKRAAPSVPVVAGALAGAGVTGTFLDDLYAAGIDGHFDVLSVHAYNDGRAPDTLVDPALAQTTVLQGLRRLRETLDRHDERRPVWVTEIGWNTSTQRGQPFLDGVTEAQQARYLRRALELLRSPGGDIGFPEAVFVYRLRDVGADPAVPDQNYGLITKARRAKPALAAVRAAFGGKD
ncbi:hypothetical protein DSM112329_03010 [Paraconexibacter sp. AEG42_29]|uniref:Glycoside hydrolase family 5 domain-containing protein n=1 Tax=Paraconexibacter sp. AEG42_29 TaxID=2997339 RepID=A0AAU7AXG3_9ACTN